MNGRIYDAKLGRFLQADPFIQAASNTQSYNRYSYVMNNPLNATDPSGFFFKKLWDKVRPFVGAIVAVVLCVYAGCAGSAETMAWVGGVSGAVGAAANGADLSGVILGAITGLAGGSGNFWVGALTAGAVSYMTGGSFGRGFAAAGIGHFVGAQGFTGVDGFIAASLAGGIASKITGGKFANGASTAAFMWALRAGLSGGSDPQVTGATGDGTTDDEINLLLSKVGKNVLSEDADGNLILTGDVAYEAGSETALKNAEGFIEHFNGTYSVSSGSDTMTLTVNLSLVHSGVGDFFVVGSLSSFVDVINANSRRQYTQRDLYNQSSRQGQCAKSCSVRIGETGYLYFRWGGQKYYGMHEAFHVLGFGMPHTNFGVMRDEGKPNHLDYRELHGLRSQLRGG